MSVLSVIKERRTVYDFQPASLSREVLSECLSAAIWAPNHKLTEPWRFWVIGEHSGGQLADIYSEHRAKKKFNPEDEGYESALLKALKKFSAIPQVILVGQVIAQDAITRQEDYAACSGAIQNIQLAAWEKGIGVQWSTGPIIKDKRTYELLEVNSKDIELIGALYMGIPNCIPKGNRKLTVEDVTKWMD